jgi:rRNA processing protein Krr1/Pno1
MTRKCEFVIEEYAVPTGISQCERCDFFVQTQLSAHRASLKKHSDEASRRRFLWSEAKRAASLGCAENQMECIVVQCPTDRVARVIGRRGANLQQIQKRHGVSIQRVADGGAMKIFGPAASLRDAKSHIERIIASHEEMVSLNEDVMAFLNAKGITAFADLRERHIHVHFDVLRRSRELRLRGLPDDLQLAKQDILRIEVCTKVLSLPAKSTAALIGKEGSTINSLVDQNQAAVTVPSKDGKTPASKVDVVIIGPSKNVEAASLAIHAILNGHMEASQTVIIDSNLKASLKMNRGEGIKELFKTVNDRFREEAEGLISVNFGEDGIVLKCKAKVLPEVVTFIETEICRLEGCTLRVEVDTFVLPAVLGKGGKGIQELSQGTRGVHVHVNRGIETSTILISGWKPDDVPKVRAALKEVLQNYVVRRIGLGDSCATSPPSLRAM